MENEIKVYYIEGKGRKPHQFRADIPDGINFDISGKNPLIDICNNCPLFKKKVCDPDGSINIEGGYLSVRASFKVQRILEKCLLFELVNRREERESRGPIVIQDNTFISLAKNPDTEDKQEPF